MIAHDDQQLDQREPARTLADVNLGFWRKLHNATLL